MYIFVACAGVQFNVMERAHKTSELTAQLASLRQQQLDASDRATYLGWTAKTQADYDGRADLISDLIARLASSNGD